MRTAASSQLPLRWPRPTGHWVMSPTTAAPISAAAAAWRVAVSIPLVNDIFLRHRGGGEQTGHDEGDAHTDAGAKRAR